MMLGLSVAGVGLMARVLLVGGVQSEPFNEDHEDEEKERLQIQLATAHDRIRALEAPHQEQVTTNQPKSVDDELADLVRRRRNSPPSS
jgi:hypothetical protein